MAAEQTRPGEDDVTRFEEGIKEAEQFRRRLLTPGPDGTSQAQILAQAIVRFRDLADKSLESRPMLNGFRLDAAELVRRIKGSATPIDGVQAFGKFRGRWYGRWDQLRVDHDWGAVTAFDPLRELPGEGSPRVRSSQYAGSETVSAGTLSPSPRANPRET
ncbi:MAG: hypothetical protein HY000_37215 [Planctomycetes bacterium]|nr:hypothetical protein [Planctomycetota bacterium]